MPSSTLHVRIWWTLIVISLFICASSATDFAKCLDLLKDEANAANLTTPAKLANIGLLDENGKPPRHVDNATSIDYRVCVDKCGAGQVSFDWSDFSQQFSSWLLPWLALVSQLPFGAESRLDNLVSVLLTVGSPTLAAYSLALTVVNSRWIYRKFSTDTIKYPNRKTVAHILNSLQQIPLRVVSNEGLLASLVVLEKNDSWWDDLEERLDYNYTWSIATATSIAWVAIAYVFTVIDSFMNLGENLNSNGQGVGTLWLWLLPLVIGWLLVPVAGRQKLVTAMHKANEIAYVATEDPPAQGAKAAEPVLARTLSDERAINVQERRSGAYSHESKSAPIFNYARVWSWVAVVEEISEAFEHASDRARRHNTVNGSRWVEADRWVEIHPDNRAGSLIQVQAYCGYASIETEDRRRGWGEGTFSRVAIASLFALGLQWSTNISSVLVVIFTPTTGLGCRSGGYLLYGIISTIIWAMLFVSSIINHSCSHRTSTTRFHSRPRTSFAEHISILLRRLSVVLASANSVLIVVVCVFQFSNVFNTCYCNSSVLGRGSLNAYNVINPTPGDMSHMKAIWIGSVVVGGGSVALFILFVSLMVEPPADARR